jgi:DNA-binding NarL/FixJ family response regulator
MKKRIVIVEDICHIRECFKEILQATEMYSVVSTYDNCEEAISNLADDQPDIVLMDIELPDMSGIEGTRIIRKKLPGCIIIIITVFEDRENVFQALCAGAGGYIIKNCNANVIVEAVAEALAGGAPMSRSISRMVVQSFRSQQDSPLSDRESEVLQCISEGKSYSRIAEELFISKETVKSHIKSIYRKLEVVSKEQAIRLANQHKWLRVRV